MRPVLDVFQTVHAEGGGGIWKFILRLFRVRVFPFLSSVLFSLSSHIFLKLVFSIDSESSFFWLHPAAYRILVPQTGIIPVFPAVEMQSPHYWTTREVP